MIEVLMTDNKWARLLAYVTGLVDQKLLLQNECLAAENRILRAHLPNPYAPLGSPTLHPSRDRQATRPLCSSAGRLCRVDARRLVPELWTKEVTGNYYWSAIRPAYG